MDWNAEIERLKRAEKDVEDWKSGLADAQELAASIRASLQEALGPRDLGPVVSNGNRHRPSHRKPPPVQTRTTHDYQRKDRIMQMIKERGGFLTVEEAAKADGSTSKVASGAMGRLVEEGFLRRVAYGRYALASEPKKAP